MLAVFLLFSIFSVLICTSKYHECMHGDVEYTLRQTTVNYKNHPYNKENILLKNQRRELGEDLTAYAYSNIRITPYYDPDTISLSTLSEANITSLKKMVSSAISFIQQFVKVIPIDSPFYIPRSCSYYYYVTNSATSETYYNCITFSSCGEMSFPDSHMDVGYLFYSSNNISQIPKGNGVQNSDFVLYVTYGSSSCGEYTLAYASPCVQDQYGRPIAGSVNICPSMLEQSDWKEDVLTILHEITHTLIFSGDLWYYFIDPTTAETLNYSEVIYDEFGDGSKKWVISPKVKELAQEYFDCDSLIGLPLEDDGGASSAHVHWEEHHLNMEYMQSTVYSSMQFITHFTMAFMEDSGWYEIDYSYAEPFFFGKSEGCNWFTVDCINNVTQTTNYEQFFCDSSADNGCIYDYSTPAYCLYYTYNSDVTFQWFTDSTHGGPENSEFCPFRSPATGWGISDDFISICWDERGNSLSTNYPNYNIYGQQSRCVDTRQSSSSYQVGRCFQHVCADYNQSSNEWLAVDILMSATENITCTASDKFLEKYSSTTSLYITCPEINVICRNEQPFACYFGNWNNDNNVCVCSPGYTGDVCDEEEDTLVDEVEEGTLTTPSPTTPESYLCMSGFTGSGFYTQWNNFDWVFSGYFDFYPYYTYSTFTIFWSLWDHTWYLTPDGVGANSYYAYCFVSEFTADISDCIGNWVVYDGGFYSAPDVESIFGSCSLSTTTSPIAIDPTLPPTALPAIVPTNNHISNPTANTLEPSQSPSMLPSNIPTIYPTESTLEPSQSPSMQPTIIPTVPPSVNPTVDTLAPSKIPSSEPTIVPSSNPSFPSMMPSNYPSMEPTEAIHNEQDAGNIQMIIYDVLLVFIFTIFIF